VIGPQGVFTIETKTLSKPEQGNPTVRYNGEHLTIGNYSPSRDPIAQAKAQAAWLRRLLKDSTGQDYPIRPVVVFPGWFVERTNKDRPSSVWVLEPKALQSFIQREEHRLSEADIGLATNHLKRHIRASRGVTHHCSKVMSVMLWVSPWRINQRWTRTTSRTW
jgi:hypothetical protein